jgi:hypothetical protein
MQCSLFSSPLPSLPFPSSTQEKIDTSRARAYSPPAPSHALLVLCSVLHCFPAAPCCLPLRAWLPAKRDAAWPQPTAGLRHWLALRHGKQIRNRRCHRARRGRGGSRGRSNGRLREEASHRWSHATTTTTTITTASSTKSSASTKSSTSTSATPHRLARKWCLLHRHRCRGHRCRSHWGRGRGGWTNTSALQRCEKVCH